MAHGLRNIVNASYVPYGNGRDYFVLGDFQYKNGRRTPDVNLRWREEQKGKIEPKKRPRGEPHEVSLSKSIFNQFPPSVSSQEAVKTMPPGVIERLRRQQSEPTCNDLLQKGSKTEVHVHRWRDSNCSKRPPKAAGCLRKCGAKDTSGAPVGPAKSVASEIGQVHLLGHSWSFSDFGAPEKHRFHSSFGKVCPPPKDENHPLAKVDDHMVEFPGKQKWPPSQQVKFYQNALEECERPLDKPLNKSANLGWGHPAKHHNFGGSNQKVFAPKDCLELEQPDRPAGWRPSEWGMADKHRYHQPPLYAPKDLQGSSRIPPGKECEIAETYRKPNMETMVTHRTFKQSSLYM